MAYEQDGPYITAPTAADLSAKDGFCVVLGSGGTVALAGAGVLVTGILEGTPGLNATTPTGKTATVRVGGTAKATAGAAITRGAHVKSDTNGRVITATTGDIAIGQALETVTAINARVPVRLNLPGGYIAT